MNREHLRTPNHVVDAMVNRFFDLMQLALPDPSYRDTFDRLVSEAQSKGCTWVEAVEYAAKQAHPPVRGEELIGGAQHQVPERAGWHEDAIGQAPPNRGLRKHREESPAQ